MTQRTKIVLERKKLRLNQLDEHGSIGRAAYFEELGVLQLKLQRIQQAYLFTGDSAVIVFEGWDAAGKGGTIRRMSAVLDPRGFKVWPIARRARSRRSGTTCFASGSGCRPRARSRYSTAPGTAASWSSGSRAWRPTEWQRAYDEINEFERFLPTMAPGW